MLKKAVQQGRSEFEDRRAYPLGYVEDLNDARTTLVDFFSILLGDRLYYSCKESLSRFAPSAPRLGEKLPGVCLYLPGKTTATLGLTHILKHSKITLFVHPASSRAESLEYAGRYSPDAATPNQEGGEIRSSFPTHRGVSRVLL